MGWREADECEYSAQMLLEEKAMPSVEKYKKELRDMKKFIWRAFPEGVDADRYREAIDPYAIINFYIERKIMKINELLERAKREYQNQITAEDLALRVM